MKRNIITIQHSILIDKPREMVWDFTQNYDNRKSWDNSVLEASVLQTIPNRIVQLKLRGNTHMTFIYKLDDKPNKTTLIAKEVRSPLIESGGGSWQYEEQSGKTIWSQTNTIIFKDNFTTAILLPVYRQIFKSQTVKAMKKAKRIMEGL